jgi:prevent-host-death family protein
MTTVVIFGCRAMREVQLRDAKASFSAVVDQAAKGETTVVTRHGAPVAVVLGYDEWQRLTHARPGLADLLLSFPEGGEPRRDRTPARDLGL